MDYINYVKQSPMQGMTGMWGGTQGALQQAAPTGGGGGTLGDYYGGRGMVSVSSAIEYWSIATNNNSSNFGSAQHMGATSNNCAAGSGARVYFAGGTTTTTEIEYFTSTTTGNGSDFGNMSAGRYAPVATCNGIRGLIGSGTTPGGNTTQIDYITVWTTGNASNFGDMTISRHGRDAVTGGTRGIFANGQDGHTKVIDYVTIATTGNASDFGNTTDERTFGSGSNSDPGSGQNRGIFFGGYSDHQGQADYINCSSTGNASDWGGLQENYFYRFAGGTNGARGYCAGGTGGNGNISYCSIDSAGSTSAGGDLSSQSDCMGCSGAAS